MFGKKLKRAYVLGAGPAGLLAAHAITMHRPDLKVAIFSAPGRDGAVKKSELYGCQYLHQYIPDLDLPLEGDAVTYEVIGDSEGYRQKVYGSGWTGMVSTDEYGPERTHAAWDLRKAYDKLWELYAGAAVPVMLDNMNVRDMATDLEAALVFTVPAPLLCYNGDHEFKTQDIWAIGTTYRTYDPNEGPLVEREAMGYPLPYEAPNMVVQCNGNRDTAWYRAATVFGYSTVEWPIARKPPVPGIAAVKKPLSTDCDCYGVNAQRWRHRAGRYGTWTKGVLVHQAYYETRSML